jgi:hypothetical protein
MLHRRVAKAAGKGPAGIPPLNFDTYELLQLAEMPKVETVLVPTYDFWGGVGEPTVCVVASAVCRDRQAGAQPAAEEREARVDGGARYDFVPGRGATPALGPQTWDRGFLSLRWAAARGFPLAAAAIILKCRRPARA